MLRCGVVENQEDQIVRFYRGLRREIQDIVDYKEYHSRQRLFQLAMLAEKELQGHQQQQRNNTFTPRQLPVPAKAAPSSSVRAATPSSTGVVRSTAPSTSKGQDSSKFQMPLGVAAKAMVPNTLLSVETHQRGATCNTRSREAPGTTGGPRSFSQPLRIWHTTWPLGLLGMPPDLYLIRKVYMCFQLVSCVQ
jgi:hypothetical protein